MGLVCACHKGSSFEGSEPLFYVRSGGRGAHYYAVGSSLALAHTVDIVQTK